MKNKDKTCKVNGCLRKVGEKGAKNLCPKHYKRFLKYGHVEKPTRKCKDCGVEFVKRNKNHYRCKECAPSYYLSCSRQNTAKWREVNKKEITCQYCGDVFLGIREKYCSRDCFYKESKKSRKGKGNPAYRNGTRIGSKNYPSKHLRANAKYRKAFLEKHGYLFCEHCGVNQSLRFETHHIVFASEAQKHKNLQDPRNQIMLCIKCHNLFHKEKSTRDYLIKSRALYELFPEMRFIQKQGLSLPS